MMAGLLDQAKQWMTPERAIAMQGLGMGLSQMSMGQPVNLSPAYQALQQRQETAKMQKVMETPGIMDRFSTEQRAALASMPESLATKIIMESLFAPAPDPAKGVAVGGNLVNPITGEVIYTGPQDGPKPTDDMREYDFARSQGYQGTFTDFMTDMRKAGASTQTVTVGGPEGPAAQLGTVPQGFAAIPDPASPAGYRMEAIPGGPEDTTVMDAAKASSRDVSTAIITGAAEKAREAAKGRDFGSLGTSAVAAINPLSDSAEVVRQVAVLKSNATIEALNGMRAQSPTGGALGNVTEKEGAMLAAKAGALDPNSPNFERDLNDYELTLLKIVHGTGEGQRIFDETRGGVMSNTGGLSVDEMKYLGLK